MKAPHSVIRERERVSWCFTPRRERERGGGTDRQTDREGRVPSFPHSWPASQDLIPQNSATL